jgi:hypothetical protein
VTVSRFWRATFRAQYRILAWLDPLIRVMWRRFGIGNVVELRVPGRKTGAVRSRMVGILHSGGRSYLGHPNGHAGWTRDLLAAGTGVMIWPNGFEWRFRAEPLANGNEREKAIRSTGQHPFPGSLVYRLGRRHVRRVGVYFRLEDIA